MDSPLALTNKTCLITGGASGIGEAAAHLFIEQGGRVVIADIQEDKGKSVVSALTAEGGEADFIHLDVTSEASWVAAMDFVRRRFQRLDVLVNNAGIGFMKPIVQMTMEQWHHVMAVNLDSVFLGIKHGAELMKANGDSGGVIINVSSNLIFKSPPDNAAYCASKSGVHMLTQVAAAELAANCIRVNTVFPGATLTPIWQPFLDEMQMDTDALDKIGGNMTLLGRMTRARDVAGAILYFASDTAAFVTGAQLIVDGGEIIKRDQKIFEAVGSAAKTIFQSFNL